MKLEGLDQALADYRAINEECVRAHLRFAKKFGPLVDAETSRLYMDVYNLTRQLVEAHSGILKAVEALMMKEIVGSGD